MPAAAIAPVPSVSRPNVSRNDLESLLRARKLDHTLTGGGLTRGSDSMTTRWLVPTGIADLDARLGGGLPRGHLSEVIGPRSSGRLAILVSALAGATARGEVVALIDPLDMFDPASARGLDFTRMLWVRGEPSSSTRVSLSCEYGTLQKALDRAVKALNMVLQAEAGGFGLVVLDLGEVPPQAIKRLPYTTWLRLHRVIEGSEAACVLIGSEPIARSSGGVTVQLTPGSGLGALGLNACVIRARKMESERNVCLSLSAPAC